LAYIAAFGYQAGYLTHFGLMPMFADVDLKQLLIAVGVLVAVFASVWISSDAAADFWSQLASPKVWGRLLARLVTILLIIFAGWLTDQRWYFVSALLLPFSVYFIGEFVVPLFVWKDTSYTQRVERIINNIGDLDVNANLNLTLFS
jgi:hypothetical protein